MRRRHLITALLLGTLATASVPSFAQLAHRHRAHRLHLPPPAPPKEAVPPTLPPVPPDPGAPPPAPPALPSSVGVTLTELSATEFSLTGSHLAVAAGAVHFYVYNKGMDPHDMSIRTTDGVLHQVVLKPPNQDPTPDKHESHASIDLNLTPGAYKLYCSIGGGTSESHENKGMVFNLTVQ